MGAERLGEKGRVKNGIICSETTSAAVTVSCEGWGGHHGNLKSGSEFPPS